VHDISACVRTRPRPRERRRRERPPANVVGEGPAQSQSKDGVYEVAISSQGLSRLDLLSIMDHAGARAS